MWSTVSLRLALAACGFALGLGAAVVVRWRPPPDLSKPVCPDCRNPNAWPIQYQYADEPGWVSGVQSGMPVGTYRADPASATPAPLDGPRFHCQRCQALWGPPAFHKPGYPRRRY